MSATKRLQIKSNDSENDYGSKKVAITPSWIRKCSLKEVSFELHFNELVEFDHHTQMNSSISSPKTDE